MRIAQLTTLLLAVSWLSVSGCSAGQVADAPGDDPGPVGGSGGVRVDSGITFINVPVLKSHHSTYGVTACVKNYMGVVTDSLGTNSHDGVGGGLMGAVMAGLQRT